MVIFDVPVQDILSAGCLAFYPGRGKTWKREQCWFLLLQGAGSLGSPSSQSSHCQPDLELTRLWPQAESRSVGPSTAQNPDLDSEASRTRLLPLTTYSFWSRMG